jgi:hypothetical protein
LPAVTPPGTQVPPIPTTGGGAGGAAGGAAGGVVVP